MATYATQHLGLSQWMASDAVLRADFNTDNQKIDDACAAIPKMAVGSYTGTGQSGADAPCSLDFGFNPMLVVITQDSSSSLRGGAVLIRDQVNSSGIGIIASSSAALGLTLTWSETGVSWYSTSGGDTDQKQLNREGATYRYFALGNG